MNIRKLLAIGCTAALAAVGLPDSWAAPATQEPPLTKSGKALMADYARQLDVLKAEILPTLPQIDQVKATAFLKIYGGESAAMGAMQCTMDAWRDKRREARLANNPKLLESAAAAKQTAADAFDKLQNDILAAAKPILDDIRPFLEDGKLDATLVRCALLADATPLRLALFAQKGEAEKKLIESLLADDSLMRQMLAAGGAAGGNYGEAMKIYEEIRKASPRANKGIFQRLALGTALEHAVPVKEFDLGTFVDPVKRYLHYEKAYLDGELDAHFAEMDTWECRFTTNSDAPDDQLAWGRKMLRCYRPDIVFARNYADIVGTDVAYQSPEWLAAPRTYQQIINGGGKCGPRAWFARFAVRCFGIPAWGVQQTSHAAGGVRTPTGWTVTYGHPWRYSWWQGVSGSSFLLDSQAREFPDQYIKALRAQWVGDALGEPKVNLLSHSGGGLWHVLAIYQKKEIVAEAKPAEAVLVGEALAEANDPAKVATDAKAGIDTADRQIVVDKDGAIIIPAVACSSPITNTEKILFMRSFDGGMQLHDSRRSAKEPGGSKFEYVIVAPAAGTYSLVARISVVTHKQHLLVASNDAEPPVEIELPYTSGLWGETEPVRITLVKGTNTLHFSRTRNPYYGLSIKQFTLTKTP